MRWALLVLGVLLAAPACAEAKWGDRDEARRESAMIKVWLKNQGNATYKQELVSFFNRWKGERSRTYASTTVEALKFDRFKVNLEQIVSQNLNIDTEWWSAPNDFTDLTWDEFARGYLGVDVSIKPLVGRKVVAGSGRKLLQTPPTSFDWVAKGKVTPVRNQSGCGACWAFAGTAAVESMQLIKRNKTWDLSEQQLIDCVNSALGYQSKGCAGGWPTDALSYLYKYNQTTEAKYPFKKVTGTCNLAVLTATTSTNVVKIATSPGYSTITGLTATSLMNAVVAQPVIVAFNAESSFQSYAGGIYSAKACSNTTVNHAMLAVSYNVGAGAGSTTAWWRLKNSWGLSWGEAGYARVQMLGDGYGACAMYYYKYVAKV